MEEVEAPTMATMMTDKLTLVMYRLMKPNHAIISTPTLAGIHPVIILTLFTLNLYTLSFLFVRGIGLALTSKVAFKLKALVQQKLL